VASRAIREAVEFAGRKFGKEVAEEGAERLAAKMAQLAAKHGDDVVVAAFKKVGPRAGRIAGEAGEHGGLALRLLARHGDDAFPVVARAASLKAVSKYGDDAAAAFIRHGAVGEQIVERFAKEGAEALAKVTPQNGRRLAMLAAEGQLKPELLSVVTRYGDEACDFVWRNKGALAIGTALTAFVAAPDEFLDGTQKLTATVAETAIKPLAEVPKTIAAEAARNTNWTVVAFVLGVVAATAAGAWRWKSRLVAWLVIRGLRLGRPRETRPT
ncbi:MAG TPA: hypothetical protein VHC19_09460, partial [Pirellulales bacterium]|nr:hypothetical protein [Pirellulales bacterium]